MLLLMLMSTFVFTWHKHFILALVLAFVLALLVKTRHYQIANDNEPIRSFSTHSWKIVNAAYNTIINCKKTQTPSLQFFLRRAGGCTQARARLSG